MLGPAVSKGTSLSLDTNFFNIGGNSLNSVSTVMALKDQGYVVGEWLGRVTRKGVLAWRSCAWEGRVWAGKVVKRKFETNKC